MDINDHVKEFLRRTLSQKVEEIGDEVVISYICFMGSPVKWMSDAACVSKVVINKKENTAKVWSRDGAKEDPDRTIKNAFDKSQLKAEGKS